MLILLQPTYYYGANKVKKTSLVRTTADEICSALDLVNHV